MTTANNNLCPLNQEINQLINREFYKVPVSDMAPKILVGDVVVLQYVGIDAVIPGETYKIHHREKGEFIRRIADDNGEFFNLSAHNRENHPDFTIYKNDVVSLARVIGLVRQL